MVKRCKTDTDFYRPDIYSDTAWPTVRGTLNPIINVHQHHHPHPFTWLPHYLHCSFKD